MWRCYAKRFNKIAPAPLIEVELKKKKTKLSGEVEPCQTWSKYNVYYKFTTPNLFLSILLQAATTEDNFLHQPFFSTSHKSPQKSTKISMLMLPANQQPPSTHQMPGFSCHLDFGNLDIGDF